MAAETTTNGEKETQRNPRPDFKQVEASPPPYDASRTFQYIQPPCPDWTFGSGANAQHDAEKRAKRHIPIDPYGAGRAAASNYKLLVSAVVPRPVALLSTRSADGRLANLAPFSYFSVVCHDPPLFTVGFAAGREAARAKDSLRHLAATRECVVCLVAEDFVEAANSAAVDCPPGVSEWDVSGLTPAYDCHTVRPARVREAVFAVEGRLESLREFESRVDKGKVTATLAVIEGTRFWVREDALNDDQSLIDPKVGHSVHLLRLRGRVMLTFW